MNSEPTPIYVGVDISKDTLQVHHQGRQRTFRHHRAGLRKLCALLQGEPRHRVVCEATGGYERDVVDALHRAGIGVSVVNPAQVRHAAKAAGVRAKTDPRDAQLLTEYGQKFHPRPTQPQAPHQREVAELSAYLQQLIAARARVKTQREHHHHRWVIAQHRQLLQSYDDAIAAVQTKLDQALAAAPALQARLARLEQIDGVGFRTALRVALLMPELGTLQRGQAAALAGLAPWTRESGTMKGRRFIGGGRAGVRCALYMAALAASMHNPVLSVLYQRLLQNGKLKKVALTAVARKLIEYMNLLLREPPTAPPAPTATA